MLQIFIFLFSVFVYMPPNVCLKTQAIEIIPLEVTTLFFLQVMLGILVLLDHQVRIEIDTACSWLKWEKGLKR